MKFTEILDHFGIPFQLPGEHHHTSAGWINLDCPWCGKDSHHFRLGYNLEGHFLNCWQCGSQNILKTLIEITGEPWHTIKPLLENIDREQKRHDTSQARGNLVLPHGLGPLLPIHKRYLEGRGFDPERLQRQWGIRGIGLAARLSWRVWIPIIQHGQIVSWTTRSVGKKAIRYLNASPAEEMVRAKDLLFGEDFARHAIVIVEGPLDAIRIGPGCVATMGISYTTKQVLRMSRYTVRVVCFDNETGAQNRAKNLCSDLSVFPGKTWNITLDSKDPGEAKPREILALRKFLD